MCSWDSKTLNAPHKPETAREIRFHHCAWNLLGTPKTSDMNLDSGKHVFPFEITLQRSKPESVQGLKDCFIRYRLRASVHWANGGSAKACSEMKVARIHNLLPYLAPEVRDFMVCSPKRNVY
jgi:arrestin-related trafficking adapter 4/5/7